MEITDKAEVTLSFELICAKCGAVLDCIINYFCTGPEVEVKPCEDCMKEAYQDGKADGEKP